MGYIPKARATEKPKKETVTPAPVKEESPKKR